MKKHSCPRRCARCCGALDENYESVIVLITPMGILTETSLVGTVDGFKIEQKDRDSRQVETKSFWKGFVAKRSKELGHCLSVCLSICLVWVCVVIARSFESC